MDIVVSSNFERLLFYLARAAAVEASVPESEKDVKAGEIVNNWMADLKSKGRFDTGAKVLAEAKKIFDAGHVSNNEVRLIPYRLVFLFTHHKLEKQKTSTVKKHY